MNNYKTDTSDGTGSDRERRDYQRYKRLLKARNFGFWEWSPATNSVLLSGAFWQTLGYPIDTYLKIPQVEELSAWIHPEDWPHLLRHTVHVLAKGSELELKVRVLKSDGQYLWVGLEGEITRHQDQQIEYVSGMALDISFQQEVEQQLTYSEERYARIIESANDGVWEWSTESGGSFHFSDRCWQQLGYDDHDDAYLSGRNRLDVWRESIHEEDRERFDKAVVNHLRDDSVFDVEYRALTKSGEWRWIRARGQALRGPDGIAVRMSGTNMDVTDLKVAQQNAEQARQAAEQANQAKSEFLSRMSHELRTPLNAILGYCQIFQLDSNLTEGQLQNVGEISKAGEHLLQLINDVLDLAKVEAGQMTLSVEPVLARRVVEEAVNWMRSAASARELTMSLHLQKWKECYVRADAMRLKQVLLNLLSNAVQDNREGGSISVIFGATADDRLCIDVSDTGTGIPECRQREMFEPFNRLGAEESGVEGSGVGLLITRHLVEMMGGELEFSSREGEGSSFRVLLPMTEAWSSPQSSSVKVAGELQTQLLFAEQKRVLYIEDNPSNIRLMEEVFSRFPQLVLAVSEEPFGGIYRARTESPDLIILDINLPRLDGFEALAVLKDDVNTSEIPVIALSANAMPHDIVRGVEAGFDDYLTKPLELERLIQALNRLLTN